MSSQECLNIKNKYIDVKSQMQRIFSYFDGCETNINLVITHLEKLILDDKAFDDGKLSKELIRITKVRENLCIIINECNSKIAEYDNLYQQALVKECEALNNLNNDSKTLATDNN